MKRLFQAFKPRGGIHPEYCKAPTAAAPIETMPVPPILRVPLLQHMGAPARPLVKKGDAVLKGQPIGEPAGFVSAWVHAPTSGVVKSIAPMVTANGSVATVVEIEADGKDQFAGGIAPRAGWETLPGRELVDIVAKAGIVGKGGAGFPTHVKLSPPPGKTIDTLIVNGAECEPYLTADHRLMVEQAERVWQGARILRRIIGAGRLCIAVEDNKPDAIASMEKAIGAAGEDVEVVILKTTYPQGAEKQLIYSVTGREVPSGGLPMDAGALVENVGTAAAVFDAVANGTPLIQRILTVSGSLVRTPKNVLARVGTPFEDLFAFCGGLTGEVGKVICGGPMMGVAQVAFGAAVTKTTSGLLAIARDEVQEFTSMPCIACGRCVDACPSGLLPCTLSEWLEAENYERAEQLHVLDCIECGACAFVCPARRPLVQHMRQGKAKVISHRRRAEAAAKKEKRP